MEAKKGFMTMETRTKSKKMRVEKQTRMLTRSSTQSTPIKRVSKDVSSESYSSPSPQPPSYAPADYYIQRRIDIPPVLRREVSSTGFVNNSRITLTRNSVGSQLRTQSSQSYNESIGNAENNISNNDLDVGAIDLRINSPDLSLGTVRKTDESSAGIQDSVLDHYTSVFHKVTAPTRRYIIVDPNPLYSTDIPSVRSLNNEQQDIENPRVILESLEPSQSYDIDQVEEPELIPPINQCSPNSPDCKIIHDTFVQLPPVPPENIPNLQSNTNNNNDESLYSSEDDEPREITADYVSIFNYIHKIGLKLNRRSDIPDSGRMLLRQFLNVVQDAQGKLILPEVLDVVSDSSNSADSNCNILPQDSIVNENLEAGTSMEGRTNNINGYNGIGNLDKRNKNISNSTKNNEQNNC